MPIQKIEELESRELPQILLFPIRCTAVEFLDFLKEKHYIEIVTFLI